MSVTRAAIEIFQQNDGVLRTSRAIELGIHPRTLYRLRDEGTIEAISRGVYRLTSLPPLSEPDLVTVALRIPQAVVCLTSALFYHGVSNEIPAEVHIALPRGTKKPKLDYPPIGVHQFAESMYEAGIDRPVIDDVEVKVYGLAKTVVDCFRFRNQIGTEVVAHALREAIHERRINPTAILEYARLCRAQTAMLPYLEALQ